MKWRLLGGIRSDLSDIPTVHHFLRHRAGHGVQPFRDQRTNRRYGKTPRVTSSWLDTASPAAYVLAMSGCNTVAPPPRWRTMALAQADSTGSTAARRFQTTGTDATFQATPPVVSGEICSLTTIFKPVAGSGRVPSMTVYLTGLKFTATYAQRALISSVISRSARFQASFVTGVTLLAPRRPSAGTHLKPALTPAHEEGVDGGCAPDDRRAARRVVHQMGIEDAERRLAHDALPDEPVHCSSGTWRTFLTVSGLARRQAGICASAGRWSSAPGVSNSSSPAFMQHAPGAFYLQPIAGSANMTSPDFAPRYSY